MVGEALEQEHYAHNGDSLQRTASGLMAWRKADNWTAFTDGARTWINGPNGVQDRPNDERFDWEGPAPAAAEAPPSPVPTPAETPWKVYDRPDLGFRVSAPAAWTEMFAGSGPPDQPSALYPETNYVFGAFDAGPRSRGESYRYLLVDRGAPPPGATLESGVRDKVQAMEADPLVAKPVSQRRLSTRSGEAGEVRWRLNQVIDGKGYSCEMAWYLFVSGDRAYTVAGVAMDDRTGEYLRVFERIAHDFEMLPAASSPQAPVAPTPIPGAPFTPDMRAVDPQNAGPGATLKELLLDVDKAWAGSWRWRPGRPVTVYRYADAGRMAGEALRLACGRIPEQARDAVAQEEAISLLDEATGAWAVLLTVKGASWGVPWEQR